MNYIPELIAFISGGGLLSLLNYFREKKKDDTTDFQVIVAEYKIMVEQFKQTIAGFEISEKECKRALDKVSFELVDLRNKINSLESSHFDLPFPMWIKDLDFRMLSLNSEYEKCFLKPNGKQISDYIGKTDLEFWGDDIGKSYGDGDMRTLNSKSGIWVGTELIVLKGNVISENWRIVKHLRYLGNTPIGIQGIAIPIF